MAKAKQNPILTPEGSKYGNGPKSQAADAEASTPFVSSCKSQLEQRHIILNRVAVLPAGTKEMQSHKESKPTTKVRQW